VPPGRFRPPVQKCLTRPQRKSKIPRAQKSGARNDNSDYATGEAGVVEIESPGTARRRERMGLPLRVHAVPTKAT
jgi:hypothetical protein